MGTLYYFCNFSVSQKNSKITSLLKTKTRYVRFYFCYIGLIILGEVGDGEIGKYDPKTNLSFKKHKLFVKNALAPYPQLFALLDISVDNGNWFEEVCFVLS